MSLRRFLCVTVFLLPCPTLLAEDSVQFRGNGGQGHSLERNLPVSWSETEHIVWKAPIPGLGWSSPAIQGNQIWVTTALEDGQSLRAVCLDKRSGRIVHNVAVLKKSDPGRVHRKNSHASPTPVIDGDRVFVHYGAHGTGCVSTDGKLLWTTNEMKFNHRHGPGGSPVVFEDLLIVNCDGTDVQFIVALNKRNGRIVWKQNRLHVSEARKSGEKSAAMAYSTPLLIEVNGRTQLISTGGDHVAAYDPRTGKEIWWSEYDGYSLVPRPVYGQGLVFVCSGFNSPRLYAVAPTGVGNVTDTHVAWTLERGAPLSPSPLLVGEELYLVSDRGIATCVNAKTGDLHWRKRLGGNYSASPTYADGRIYILDEDGKCTVISPGEEYKELSINQVDGRTFASLAASDEAFFLRTDTHLYRIGGKGKE